MNRAPAYARDVRRPEHSLQRLVREKVSGHETCLSLGYRRRKIPSRCTTSTVEIHRRKTQSYLERHGAPRLGPQEDPEPAPRSCRW